jgi:hypothetical protein
MSELRAYKCDICGREKGDVNHWFVVRVGEAFHVYKWDFWFENNLEPLGGKEGVGDTSSWVTVKHVCGQDCLMRLQQGWLRA